MELFYAFVEKVETLRHSDRASEGPAVGCINMNASLSRASPLFGVALRPFLPAYQHDLLFNGECGHVVDGVNLKWPFRALRWNGDLCYATEAIRAM